MPHKGLKISKSVGCFFNMILATNITFFNPPYLRLQGCSLLDVDPGSSTNRTVYTFVGPPEAVVNGALNGARAAAGLIDMRTHKGIRISVSLFVTELQIAKHSTVFYMMSSNALYSS